MKGRIRNNQGRVLGTYFLSVIAEYLPCSGLVTPVLCTRFHDEAHLSMAPSVFRDC